MFMQKSNIKISVIIVHYNVKKELFECIKSIYKSNPQTTFEIIVVDNDEKKVIKKDLLKKFPNVKYLENKNNGWGGGTNAGLKLAKGEFVYLLNPDTIFVNNALDASYKFAIDSKAAGVVASMLYDKKKRIYELQGTRLLTPLRAIFSLSFINKLFPNNPISKDFWMKGWDKTKTKRVESATLSAALIKKETLIKAGGFDENLFLYYEEHDLAKRLSSLKVYNYIIPQSKVIHLWEVSSGKTGRTSEFIKKSREHYFNKYYGKITAAIVEFFMSLSRQRIINYISLFLIVLIAVYLRFNGIERYIPFIGDQAWFYLSARNMVLDGKIPLLGIESSHPWIHQGPLWTYFLAPVLAISNFNPIAGSYLSNLFGIGTVVLAFVVGRRFVSSKFGLIFSFLFAISPLAVYHSRFAYHTSPIPFFVLLLSFFLYKWLKGNVIFFPIIMLTMFILYNFELATVILWPVIIFFLAFGILKKKSYIQGIKSKKIFIFSTLAFMVPMLPILIHDFQNGFPQTVMFGAWFFYKGFQFLGLIQKSPMDESSILAAIEFFFEKYHTLTLPVVKSISMFIFFSSLIVTIINLFKHQVRVSGSLIMFLLTLIGLVAFILSGVPSEAYLVMLFPGLIYFFAVVIYRIKKSLLILAALLLIGLTNVNYIISSEYLTKGSITLKEKSEAVDEIINLLQNNNYELTYEGIGEEFESSVMPYRYLIWLKLRHISREETSKREILIIEQAGTLTIEER